VLCKVRAVKIAANHLRIQSTIGEQVIQPVEKKVAGFTRSAEMSVSVEVVNRGCGGAGHRDHSPYNTGA
jgi:hypothetical protein